MTRLKNLKAVLITVFLTGITIASFAQFTAGGRIGANFANLRGSSIQNNSMIVGYNVGGFFNYSMEDMITSDFGKIMSLQVEFVLEQKGATTDYLFYSDTLGTTIDTVTGAKQVSTYMTIPIIAKFTFGDPKALQYFGEAGIYMAALSGLTVNGNKWRDHDDNPATDKRKFREEYSGFDYGFIVGAGASMPFGGRKSPWRAYANLRYAMGFTNIGELKEKTIDIPEGQLEEVKTSAISLLLGVSFSF
jgi:hypothetical protein